jgi:hypothetical protein
MLLMSRAAVKEVTAVTSHEVGRDYEEHVESGWGNSPQAILNIFDPVKPSRRLCFGTERE